MGVELMRAFGLPTLCIFYCFMGGIALLGLMGVGDAGLSGAVLGASSHTETAYWLWSLCIGAGVGLIMVALSRALSHHFDWAGRLTDEFRSLLGDLRARDALLIAALSSMAEELLFRALLQPALGLFVAAAVFGLMHVGPNRNFVPWTIMAFVAGLAFGLLTLWTGSVLAAVIAHFTVNYLNLRYLAAPRGVVGSYYPARL